LQKYLGLIIGGSLVVVGLMVAYNGYKRIQG
jgi:hypothetical protein